MCVCILCDKLIKADGDDGLFMKSYCHKLASETMI